MPGFPVLYCLLVVVVQLLSSVQHFVNPWTAAFHAPLSMGFARQEYWSGVPLPSPPEVCELGCKEQSGML